MKVRTKMKIRFEGNVREVDTLFDSGASISVMSSLTFRKLFGAKWKKLDKPIRLVLVNGDIIVVDKYVVIDILIGNTFIPIRIFLSDDIKEKAIVDAKEIKIPDLIIGAGTMDELGIELHPEKGIVMKGLLLI